MTKEELRTNIDTIAVKFSKDLNDFDQKITTLASNQVTISSKLESVEGNIAEGLVAQGLLTKIESKIDAVETKVVTNVMAKIENLLAPVIQQARSAPDSAPRNIMLAHQSPHLIISTTSYSSAQMPATTAQTSSAGPSSSDDATDDPPATPNSETKQPMTPITETKSKRARK